MAFLMNLEMKGLASLARPDMGSPSILYSTWVAWPWSVNVKVIVSFDIESRLTMVNDWF